MFDSRVKALMPDLIKTGRADAKQTDELYELHNEIFSPKEQGKNCGGCRDRVYRRMLTYYEGLTK